MDLQNSLVHKKNSAVTVNGTVYQIDGDGVARGVSDEDAKKMLQGNAWSVHVDKTPVATPPAKKAAPTAAAKEEPEDAGDAEAANADGTDDAAGDAEEDTGLLDEAGDDAGDAGTSEETPPTEDPAADAATTETTAVTVAPGEIPEEGQNWPDPDEDMDIAYLRTMAEAYDAAFDGKTNRKTLVKRIKAKMYD